MEAGVLSGSVFQAPSCDARATLDNRLVSPCPTFADGWGVLRWLMEVDIGCSLVTRYLTKPRGYLQLRACGPAKPLQFVQG